MKKKLKRSQLVRNRADRMVSNRLVHFTTGISFNRAKIRKEVLNGRSYTVVPMVMLNVGVHPGSLGPLFYPKTELSKPAAVANWNMKPVVVYHPEIDGEGVSACDPEILEQQQIGMMMNTRFDSKNRLTSEAWLEDELVRKVDIRVWNAIKKGQVMELSTGLFTDNEMTEGEYEGEEYVAIARNHRADHLAVLPDVKGAFSVERGAGFIRNELKSVYPDMEEDEREIMHAVLINALKRFLRKSGLSCQEQTNKGIHMTAKKMVADLIANHGYKKSDREMLLDLDEAALKAIHRAAQAKVTANKSRDDDDDDDDEDSDEEDEDEGTVENGDNNENCDTSEMKKKKKKKMATNEGKKKKKKVVVNEEEDDDSEEDEDETDEDENDEEEVVKNDAPVTMKQFIAKAPPAIREILETSITNANIEKKKLVKGILANKKNSFSKEELRAMSLNQLKRIAQLAAEPARNKKDEDEDEEDGSTDFRGQGVLANGRDDDDDDENEDDDEDEGDEAPVKNDRHALIANEGVDWTTTKVEDFDKIEAKRKK